MNHRDENPSGLGYILQEKDMKYLLECIIESPPNHSSTLSNLLRRSGVEKEEFNNCVDKLESLNIIYIVNKRYVINDESPIVKELHHLNSAINSQAE